MSGRPLLNAGRNVPGCGIGQRLVGHQAPRCHEGAVTRASAESQLLIWHEIHGLPYR